VLQQRRTVLGQRRKKILQRHQGDCSSPLSSNWAIADASSIFTAFLRHMFHLLPLSFETLLWFGVPPHWLKAL
jgi:hypothetical protein